jgi:hypothetical protein
MSWDNQILLVHPGYRADRPGAKNSVKRRHIGDAMKNKFLGVGEIGHHPPRKVEIALLGQQFAVFHEFSRGLQGWYCP